MTRKEIEAAYDVANGVIRSPGKFEAEMACSELTNAEADQARGNYERWCEKNEETETD